VSSIQHMQLEQGKVISGRFWREEAFKFEGSALSTSLFKRRRWQKNRIKDLHSCCPALPWENYLLSHVKTIQFSHLLISLRLEFVFIKPKFQFSIPVLVLFNNIVLFFPLTSKIIWKIFAVPLQELLFQLSDV